MTSSTSGISTLFLIVNGFVLALALAFLLIILWYDIRRAIYQFFALFLVLVAIWNCGYILQQAGSLMGLGNQLANLATGIINIGFAGSSAALYALCAILIGTQLRFFRTVAALAILFTVAFNIVVLLSQIATLAPATSAQNIGAFFYLLFDGATVFIAWRYRRTLQNNFFITGIVLFVAGQGIGFFNQESGISAAALFISSLGCLVISGSFVRRELITPLVNRNQQLLSMHEMSLAITTRIATSTLLSEIAERATSWLSGDAAAIYLQTGLNLKMGALHNLPISLYNTATHQTSFAHHIAKSKSSALVEHYREEWSATDELTPLADAFGSVIGTPLIYDDQVIGVLLVIASRQSRIFSRQDLALLELLGSQASVAIAHDRLFSNRELLSSQIQLANEQLQTVLTSTRSPVLALDRNLMVVFSNGAAVDLMRQLHLETSAPMLDGLPPYLLPRSTLHAVRDIKQHGVHIYEVRVLDKTYQCHLAAWGSPKIEGWVAVLHDVSELKELDRIKSEMVRMTSHDLKNPLQAALANLDLLQDDLADMVGDKQEMRVSANNVEKQLVKMQRIISGILDLERVRIGVHLNEICSPSDIVNSVVEELYDIAQDRNISLETSVASNVGEFAGDKAQFERALVNLTDNAIKFTSKGGKVHIEVSQQGLLIEFAVSDTGVGIPEELQDKIFERFYRGRQSGIEHVSGSGLGLSLVKAVVESHHGRLWVMSESGNGSTFFIQVTALREPSTIKS